MQPPHFYPSPFAPLTHLICFNRWDTYIPEKTISSNYCEIDLFAHSTSQSILCSLRLLADSITTYASALVTKIKTGAYKSSAASWINCTNPTLHQKRDTPSESDVRSLLEPSAFDLDAPRLSARATDLECPLLWAQDSNALVCSTGK